MELIDRYRGCMIGLATGDALGTTLEFQTPGTFEPIEDIIGGGPFGLQAGEWTDDTSMALCLAESLITKKKFDPVDQLERYLKWYKEGYLSSNGYCFDVGNTVLQALLQFEKTRNPFCGRTDPETASNGSIMRVAPILLFYANDPSMAITLAGESSKTTHGAKETIDACRYLGALIIGSLQGRSKREILSNHYSPTPNFWKNYPLVEKIDEIAHGSFKKRNPPEIRGSGYVVKSLEAALWAFYNSDSFEEGCLKAVNLGDDADTTGAVYGQLAGTFYGYTAIPKSWQSKIAHKKLIQSIAEKIFSVRI